MENVVITSGMLAQVNTIQVNGKNNVKIEVKQHIPYVEKESFALEYALYCNVEDADNEMMYDNFKAVLIKTMLVAKYYTNIDVAAMNDEADWMMLFDMLVFNHMYDAMMDIVAEDMKYVDQITNTMLHSMRQVYRHDHSLERNIQKTFGFLFTGEDLTETIAKANEVTNEVTELIGTSKKLEKLQGAKNDKLQIEGGAILNLAKKKTTTKKG